ncbi:hypothetical protein IWX90DRAFT_179011 [Phyllosticta citrichinensis]|uniref:Uncharacterized protein n=1 Tax=Phyllosticta citrichinensis TaxID=1130410 RepID=A0ABR1XW34_9PEZI
MESNRQMMNASSIDLCLSGCPRAESSSSSWQVPFQLSTKFPLPVISLAKNPSPVPILSPALDGKRNKCVSGSLSTEFPLSVVFFGQVIPLKPQFYRQSWTEKERRVYPKACQVPRTNAGPPTMGVKRNDVSWYRWLCRGSTLSSVQMRPRKFPLLPQSRVGSCPSPPQLNPRSSISFDNLLCSFCASSSLFDRRHRPSALLHGRAVRNIGRVLTPVRIASPSTCPSSPLICSTRAGRGVKSVLKDLEHVREVGVRLVRNADSTIIFEERADFVKSFGLESGHDVRQAVVGGGIEVAVKLHLEAHFQLELAPVDGVAAEAERVRSAFDLRRDGVGRCDVLGLLLEANGG